MSYIIHLLQSKQSIGLFVIFTEKLFFIVILQIFLSYDKISNSNSRADEKVQCEVADKTKTQRQVHAKQKMRCGW